MATIRVEACLDENNQITLPEAAIQKLKLKPGDRVVVELEEDGIDQVQLRPIRRSYAGILSGVYGTEEEALEYIRAERASWDQ
jgi:AbrB family looped-hinge helix DNA binding protein